MKKKLALLLTTAVVLLAAACGGGNGDGNDNGYNGGGNGGDNGAVLSPDNGAVVTPAVPNEPSVPENSPAAAVSAFFGYLVDGNVWAADTLLINSVGDFAREAGDYFDTLGVHIFRDISYDGLMFEFGESTDTALAVFSLTNVNYPETWFEAEFLLEENAEDGRLYEIIAEKIINGTAPTFVMDMFVELVLTGEGWQIVDADYDLFMAVLGFTF